MMSRISMYHTARSTHLVRAEEVGARLIYRKASYDFDLEFAKDVGAKQVNWIGWCREALKARGAKVELNEPAAVAYLPSIVSALIALRFGRLVSGARGMTLAYAIENGPIQEWIAQKSHIPLKIVSLLFRPFFGLVLRQYDRIVFGTQAARSNYEQFGGNPRLSSWCVVDPIEPRCPCTTRGQVDKKGVLFLGALVPRKGITEFLEAAPLISSEITVLGKGELAPKVSAQVSPVGIRFIEDPDRTQIHNELRRARVLVLPSQPVRGWIEQIGLPILEGLSHGCHIVTTPYTGIREWLTHNGHTIIPADSDASVIAEAVQHALTVDDSDSVFGSLPEVSGRLLADQMLFGSEEDL